MIFRSAAVALLAVLVNQSFAAEPALTTVRVAAGLDAPVFLTAPAGDHHRLFVLEQNLARIRIIKDGVLLPNAFLDVSGVVLTGGERGLLGLAFHPNYASNGRFFIYYTRKPDGAVAVARYVVSANPDVADAASALVLLTQTKSFDNHNGGTCAFGPDGMLYLGLGDGGSANDPNCNAQNLSTLLGKMLRIDVDSASPYAIPPTNPFVGTLGARGEIWARGMRNPYRFTFDRGTGELWIGDVGQGAREEVDVQSASSVGGENYGWKMVEGTKCNSSSACPTGTPTCTSSVLTAPVWEYSHGSGDCAIIGGAVYRGCAIPGLQGAYFFADYCSARIWSLRWSGGAVSNVIDRTAELHPAGGLSIDLVSGFGEDADGELYILDLGGEVFRVVANAPAPATDLGFGKVGGNGRVPQMSACGLLDQGHASVVRVREAPPLCGALVIGSTTSNPTPMLMGTLVPSLASFVSRFVTTGGDGSIAIDVLGGMGPIDVYTQCLLDDPGATAGVGFSNALAIHFLP